MKIPGMHQGNTLSSTGPTPIVFGQAQVCRTDEAGDRFERREKPPGNSLTPGVLGTAMLMAMTLAFGTPATGQAQVIPLPFEQPEPSAAAQMEKLTQVLGLAGKDSVTVQDYRDAFFKRYLQGFGQTLLDLKRENPELPISAEQYALAFDDAFLRPFAQQFNLDPDSPDEHDQMAFFRLMEWTLPKALDVRNSAEVNDLAQAKIREKLDFGGDSMQWWMLASLTLENPAMTDEKIRELFDVPEALPGIFPLRPMPRPDLDNGFKEFEFRTLPYEDL